jgi:seryl-tRNA synthetase
MQHETISLKAEKALLKEINDLKAQRKQLSSNIGSKAEINEAFDQKDHIHERHKVLKAAHHNCPLSVISSFYVLTGFLYSSRR